MKLPSELCDEMFSKLDIDTKRYIINIVAELDSARKKHPKWPIKKRVAKSGVNARAKFHDLNFVKAAAIVGEEAGELIRAALIYEDENGPYYSMHQEAIQTAAMALRFLVESPVIELPS